MAPSGWLGEFLTLSSSEHNSIRGQFPSDAGVSSLSDILETGDVPQRFFLSPRACRGIVRRNDERGKTLVPALDRALREGMAD